MIATGSPFIRMVVTYAVVLPLALFLGYMLATPLNYSSMAMVGLALVLLSVPLLLKWHTPLLLLSLSSAAVVPFVPGQPSFWLVMAFVSLLVVVAQRCVVMNMRFIYAPSLVLPMLFFMSVVFVTGRLTHSFGLRILGSHVVGSRWYLSIFAGAAVFFALLAVRIPREKARLCINLYLLAPLPNLVTSLVHVLPAWAQYIYLVFPVSTTDFGTTDAVVRLSGLPSASGTIFSYFLAHYGVRGVLAPGKRWRLLVLIASVGISSLGGFRSGLMASGLIFLLMFYLEGLVRSKYFMWLIFGSVLGLTLLVPFSQNLPIPTQRAISIIPGLQIDPLARQSAEASNDWRLGIWKTVLPQIPQYLWLGKGLGVSVGEVAGGYNDQMPHSRDEEADHIIAVGNLHSGPLTMLYFFGVWGALGWLWFVGAAIRALYYNCRYGEEHLRSINTFFLATILVRVFMFLVVVGDIRTDVFPMAALVGFSLALNHGIRMPPRASVPKPLPIRVRPRVTAPAGA